MFNKVLSVVVFTVIIFNKFNNTEGFMQLLDLTWAIDENSVTLQHSGKFKFVNSEAGFNNKLWYAANDFCMPEHCGTHLDAPFHLDKKGKTVGELSVMELIGNGILIDMQSDVFRHGANASLTAEKLAFWEKVNGPINDGSIMLIRFGWSKYYKRPNIHLGIDHMGQYNFPGISKDAAEWIVSSRKIIGVGVDTPGIDLASNLHLGAHYLLASHGIYTLKNVHISTDLPARDFVLAALPLKLAAGTGAPVRVVAFPTQASRENPSGEYYVVSRQAVPWYGHTSVVLSVLLMVAIYFIDCFNDFAVAYMFDQDEVTNPDNILNSATLSL